MHIDGSTILVTGGNGFVGGRVSRRLVADGARVRAIVRRPGEAEVLADDGIDEVPGDFTDPDDLAAAMDGVDAVVHAAATAGDDLEQVRAVNTLGTRTVVGTALVTGVRRLVHISTAGVYHREGDEIDEATPRLGDPGAPDEGSPYAITKAEAEREVEAGMGDGLAATILRPPAILGWAPTSTWGQTLPARIAAGELPFTPNPETTHVWVHVDDLADAVALVLTDDRSVGRTYDVIGGNATWREYIDAVLGFVPEPSREVFDGDPPEAWTGRFTGRRLRDELGWEPRRSFAEGMAEAAEHFRG